jgi:hypothetical protein
MHALIIANRFLSLLCWLEECRVEARGGEAGAGLTILPADTITCRPGTGADQPQVIA